MLCPVYGHELTPLSCPPSQGVSFRSFKGLIILSPYSSIRTNTPLERIKREIRRRTGVVGNFPDGQSALMLVCAGLRYYIAGHKRGTERYLNMQPLYQSAF